MESKRINELLEKYWECETSLEEEQELKSYFLVNPEDKEFENSGYLFQYLSHERSKDLPSNFFSDDRWLKEVESQGSIGDRRWHSLNFIWKVAAVVVIGLTAAFFGSRWISQNTVDKTPLVLQTDTYQTPEEAYAETMKALMLISHHMNTGREQTMKLAVFNEAEETIESALIN